ncbi:MAG: HD domain-containing protein [Desulfovibrionaceae bacterium]
MNTVFDYTTPQSGPDVQSEVFDLARECGLQNLDRLERAFHDVERLFHGRYPGYRASNTKYHNFEHTLAVVLAAARLLSGCRELEEPFSPRDVELCLLASLMHDVGLIQKEEDTSGTGAKYTVGHEERSIEFMQEYFARHGFSATESRECAQAIRSTILAVSPQDVECDREELRRLGHVVGSADLLAQLADRVYLEKLLLLYQEFEEARLPGFDSELDLITKSLDFYTRVAKVRLKDQLGDLGRCMRAHCRAKLGEDRDLYAEAVTKNIGYLEQLIGACGGDYGCYLDNLRRAGIADEVRKTRGPAPVE